MWEAGRAAEAGSPTASSKWLGTAAMRFSSLARLASSSRDHSLTKTEMESGEPLTPSVMYEPQVSLTTSVSFTTSVELELFD